LRFAACEQTCNLCGRVCPTQAIRNLDLEEKKYARMGTAVILKEKCLVWEQDKPCLICDEQCPYNAIVFKMVDGFRRPFVLENKCNGCGFCENTCPVEGGAAIVVTPLGEIRLKEGSYRAAAQASQLTLQEDKGYDDFILEGESPSQDNSTD
jgi:ferredoxin